LITIASDAEQHITAASLVLKVVRAQSPFNGLVP
jgi:hypothetical protein